VLLPLCALFNYTCVIFVVAVWQATWGREPNPYPGQREGGPREHAHWYVCAMCSLCVVCMVWIWCARYVWCVCPQYRLIGLPHPYPSPPGGFDGMHRPEMYSGAWEEGRRAGAGLLLYPDGTKVWNFMPFTEDRMTLSSQSKNHQTCFCAGDVE
jgi:hypothetical protein